MIDNKIPASFEDVGILFGLTITFAFLNKRIIRSVYRI